MGLTKNSKREYELEFVLWFWQSGIAGMILSLTMQIVLRFASYQQSFALDHYLGASTSRGPAGIYGF
jgi:hypothetical protein